MILAKRRLPVSPLGRREKRHHPGTRKEPHLIAHIGLPLDLPIGGILRCNTPPSCCDSWRVPGQGHASCRTVTHSGAHERAAARKYGQFQVEDEEKLPDWLAVEAVVL